MNCSELFEKFIEYKRLFVCDRTLEKYWPIVKSLEEVYGLTPANQLTKADVPKFISHIQSEGKAPETLKRKLFLLKACWDWAIECELVGKNPWKNLPKLVRENPVEMPKPFTSEEIQKIIDGFESFPNYKQLVPFVKFLFLTGCRTGEAIGLRWGDVTPDCRVAKIQTQLARGERKRTKTGKSRTLFLTPQLQNLLLGMRPENPNPDALIFLWNSNPVDAMNFRARPWKKVLEKAGVDYRKPYCTRHTFISHCLEKGINPVDVAAMCGNSTRVIYAHYAGVIHPPQIPEICQLSS
ncbi:MAG TPA: site-specific integrase [Kamptonema sp.]|nr:site-specific integrase [Kamptonema sp.]